MFEQSDVERGMSSLLGKYRYDGNEDPKNDGLVDMTDLEI
jgi:hypothetical protein